MSSLKRLFGEDGETHERQLATVILFEFCLEKMVSRKTPLPGRETKLLARVHISLHGGMLNCVKMTSDFIIIHKNYTNSAVILYFE